MKSALGLAVTAPVEPVIIGKIGAPHGILGWVRLFSYTDPAENILTYQPLLLNQHKMWYHAQLEDAKPHKQDFIIKLKDFHDRNQACLITNCQIAIERGQLPAPSEDEFYWHDLIGMTVLDEHGQTVGQVYSLFETPNYDIMVVKSPDKEHLIPWRYRTTVTKVDVMQRIVHISWANVHGD